MRVLIGGVGYPDLCDHSISWAVVDWLLARGVPPGVSVEDASYNPVAVAQRLDDSLSPLRFDRAVFVSAVPRGRPYGAVTSYRWDRQLPPADEIQRAVSDAVTGIISLDNTLIVTAHLDALPADVAVVEVEPVSDAFGAPFTSLVESTLDTVCNAAVRCATDTRYFHALPMCGLGGPVLIHG